jgi:hypothetical protein
MAVRQQILANAPKILVTDRWHVKTHQLRRAGVVADKSFQKAKFVDRNFDLGYDVTEGSICKFVTIYCNLQANIDVGTWFGIASGRAKKIQGDR